MVKKIGKSFLFLILSLGLVAAVCPPADGGKNLTQNSEPCGANAQISRLLELTSQDDWSGWIARLSGLDPVILDTTATTIQTRSSFPMFRGASNARAYEYVLTRLRGWYPAQQIEEDGYVLSSGTVWKNIILTIPGANRPAESVILSAHLDSTSDNADIIAPGAEDNATGSAALLEAARIFRTHRFTRTLRLIWFTGEEQGLLGSKAYVEDHNLSGVTGVINLDMYGYDPDQDGCFELHVGTMPASAPVGACFSAAASIYSPQLKVNLIDAYDMRFSDHNSFWEKGIGAVEVLENFTSGQPSDACGGIGEHSPYYHKTTDTLNHLNLSTGFAITRAGLAAAASLAEPLDACFSWVPYLSTLSINGQISLAWTAVPGAAGYRIYRSDASAVGQTALCSAEWIPVFETKALNWTDPAILPELTYAYRVEALGGAGCVSATSACVESKVTGKSMFLP
jgi:hypothetical protein